MYLDRFSVRLEFELQVQVFVGEQQLSISGANILVAGDLPEVVMRVIAPALEGLPSATQVLIQVDGSSSGKLY